MAKGVLFNGMDFSTMHEFLEEKFIQYNNRDFIPGDPVSVPHRYHDLQDIEISGFLAATLAWGRRDLILTAAGKLLSMMGDSPYDFLMDAGEDDILQFSEFYYRTFKGVDCMFFMHALRNIYLKYDSMEDIIVEHYREDNDIRNALQGLRQFFFSLPYEPRTKKHFADVSAGAAGKRLNMFLRWMVRRDNRGVDFGLWRRISPSSLFVPLDFHSGNTARKLGLLTRKANDWKAVEELSSILRLFDPDDPVKYDFALFGLGVNEKF